MEDIKNNLKYFYLRAKSTIMPTKIVNFEDIQNMESEDRVISPPEMLIPEGEYKDCEKGFGSRKTTVRVMTTPHGFYVKPKKDSRLSEICYESAFGFGLSGSGFNEDRVVYYPNCA